MGLVCSNHGYNKRNSIREKVIWREKSRDVILVKVEKKYMHEKWGRIVAASTVFN